MKSIKWTKQGYFNLIGILHNHAKLGLHKTHKSFVFNLPFLTVIHIKSC